MRNNIIKKITRWEDKLVRYEEFIVSIALQFIVIVVFINVMGRYVFTSSLRGLDEVARYIIPLIVMIGSAVGVRKRNHVVAGDIRRFCKGEESYVYGSLVLDTAALVFCVFFAVWSWQHWLYVLRTGSVTAQLGIPMALVEIVLPIGAILWVLHYVLHIIRAVNDLQEKSS